MGMMFLAELLGSFGLAFTVLNAGTSADYEGNSFFGLGELSLVLWCGVVLRKPDQRLAAGSWLELWFLVRFRELFSILLSEFCRFWVRFILESPFRLVHGSILLLRTLRRVLQQSCFDLFLRKTMLLAKH